MSCFSRPFLPIALVFFVLVPGPTAAQTTLSFPNVQGTGWGGFVSVRNHAVGDLNGDGLLDLAVTNANQLPQVAVSFGGAGGTFVVPGITFGNTAVAGIDVVLPVSNVPDIHMVDLNNDGNLDLAISSYGVAGDVMLLGNGDGTFQAPIIVPTYPQHMRLSKFADFNNDGNPDMIHWFVNEDYGLYGPNVQVWAYEGIGDGNFVLPGYQVALRTGATGTANLTVGDYNNDGNMDLGYSYRSPLGDPLAIVLGDGAFGFAPASDIASPNVGSTGSVSEDFNGDGNLDILQTTNQSLFLALGDGTGAFNTAPGTPIGSGFGGGLSAFGDPGVADMDGNGTLDIVLAFSTWCCNATMNNVQPFRIYLNDGNAVFTEENAGPVGLPLSRPHVDDFDGDGIPDMIGFRSQAVYLLGTSPPLLSNGATCATDGDCASGFCADGVCCDSACDGGASDCQACSIAAGAAVDGACAPISGCTDTDGDNVSDATDNCPTVPNPGQEDLDFDGGGDACDCAPTNPLISPSVSEVCNGQDDNCDGAVDEGLPDADGDGTCDAIDPFPNNGPLDSQCASTVTVFNGAVTKEMGFCLASCSDAFLTAKQFCRKDSQAQAACAGRSCNSTNQPCRPDVDAIFSPGLIADCTENPALTGRCAPGLVFCGCSFDIPAGESIRCPCACDCD